MQYTKNTVKLHKIHVYSQPIVCFGYISSHLQYEYKKIKQIRNDFKLFLPHEMINPNTSMGSCQSHI